MTFADTSSQYDNNWREQLSERADKFEPYTDNGGTVIAIAGADFAIIAADTRLSEGYTILSRGVTRLHGFGSSDLQQQRTFLATAGCWSVRSSNSTIHTL
jgi:20S proteasome alpha/beta subunit